MDRKPVADPKPDRTARMTALFDALQRAGFEAERLDAAQLGVDMATILLTVPSADGTDTRAMTVTVLPDNGALEHADLVQGWIGMGPATEGDAARLATANVAAPLGHSAIQEGQIHHRHVWPVQAGQALSPDAVAEWISLLVFSADTVLADARAAP